MTGITIICDPDAVDAYLDKHGLQEGSVPIESVLLQRSGTSLGKPAVMITFRMPDGQIVLGKTTLTLLAAAMGAINAALGGRSSE